MRNNQQGFSAFELIIILAVIALLAFVGWRYFNATDDSDSQPSISSEEAPEVNDSNGLEESQLFLEEHDLDAELDTSELDQVLEES